jgi:propanediol dehydratase small subunit
LSSLSLAFEFGLLVRPTARMSALRILVGLLMAALVLAAELVAYWHFGFEAKWVPIVLFAVLTLAGGTLMHFQTWKALRPYWERACTGIRWRRRFPNSPKGEIREFLDLFIDAFAFSRRRRCCFLPEDRVMDVYHAIYPPGSAVDGMELESLCRTLQKRYAVDFAASWREDITLGEIYEKTHRTA